MVKNTENAFKWIVGLLRKNNIPFQISGGFAARLYGSTRPLFDIDIDIPDSSFDKLLPFVQNHVVYGPKRSRDECWDLLLMTLKYENQEIDISGSETIQLFNREAKKWEPCYEDLNDIEVKEVYGEKVPVIKKEYLISYKNVIRRPTDLEDIEMIS
ncbi:hypothetical protein A2272_06895 [Candidatus Peregrinibacteria bacterium RIFOXYA12_FULL_33_12]|nr:MAG: hypothetical protein A2272_06895 [Candidatus Peregrinibacteria bacterium RIFOXYA12_FULL_33_12]OGJ45920.1 MAG: hypothetical protein A2263_03795 [Candidatus Peregrinibacteria bacterium RIFOXYA2_FULL_33_21]OGJ51482.1 MAG: hypothetical protein A2307_00230 [Candidatus Peregrinibacteria bacterium RIFOXYB2_FULL_33_20]